MTVGVLAVVPTFCPDSADLLSLVGGLRAQSVPVMVVDDASPVTADRVLHSLAAMGVEVIRHERNAGIARSLNDGLTRASALGATWLLTVDQDSELDDTYVSRLLEATETYTLLLGTRRIGAVAAGSIDDASGVFAYPLRFVDNVATTAEVIQTGTLWRVEALRAFGGFDESFGIDAVDAAACLRLRERGYLIVLAPAVRIRHRVGEGRQVNVFGWSVFASGHAPHRRTTIVRNRLRLFPAEFAQSPSHALRTLRRVVVNIALAVTIEDDRWEKAKASARGLIHATKR